MVALCRHRIKPIYLLLGISVSCWIIYQTGISEYWMWLFFRKITGENMQPPKWERWRGKLMNEFIEPFNKNILIQPNNFTAVVENNPFAVMFVITCPESKDRRMWIRNTWYTWKDKYNIQIIFFMGIRNTLKFNSSMEEIIKESEMYQDIVMDDFEEHYYTLAIKVLRIMKFYLEIYKDSSGQLPFLIKVDDDVFVNVPNLVNQLQSKSSTFVTSNAFTAGHIHQFAKPNPNSWSKYYIPYDVWDGYWFPAYAGGPCYTISGNLVKRIYNKSLEMQFFPFEDVFITGIVANHELGISPLYIKGIHLFISEESIENDDEFVSNSVALAPLSVSEKFMNKCFQIIVASMS